MTLLDDSLICLRFFSRLPLPRTARESELGAGGLALAMPMAPVAGLVLGLIAAAVLTLASSSAGLPPFPSAAVALTSLVLLTGALHEDALADCADGFGGGRVRDRKLAIMRDSAVGAYGATAIVLSLMLRCGAIAAALAQGRAGAAIVVAAVLSRAACFVPSALLAPARSDGVGAAVTAVVDRRRLVAAWLVALALAALCGAVAGAGVGRAAIAFIAAVSAALAVTALARHQIGGQTGDVAGMAQQAAEIAVLLVFAAGAG